VPAMAAWALHYDLRGPAIGPPAPVLYRAALEQSAWADTRGAASIVVSEHHGQDDGYLPSPLTMAAALAARTTNAFLSVNALVLSLHDPVAIAEQALVVDNLSAGRLVLTVVPGYVPSEFAMFGVDHAARASVFESKVVALTAAMTGEPFTWSGRTIRVTPPPVQRPRPMVLIGGGSKAAARRAARLGDGFGPTTPDPALRQAYADECQRLGRPPGLVAAHDGPLTVHVADDPDVAWELVGPHVLHELRSYGAMAAQAGERHPYAGLATVQDARDTGVVAVVTPDECVALARSLPPGDLVVIKPLIGGLDPDVAWSSLELFASKVLPALE
jgi:alkanesulfonate monooxygenase SsuD/methylene tetrahydromethanopterin reductase-like flavin-dependent oxidoreductase (luciferase family)